MAWTTPRTWVSGELVTAALMNTHIRDNDNALEAREFIVWTPPHHATNALSAVGDWSFHATSGSNDLVYFSFTVPADFDSLVSAEAIFYAASSSGTVTFTHDTDYGADGQNYNNHSEQTTGNTVSATQNQLDSTDVSDVMTGIAASDHVGLKITDTGTARTCRWLGLKIVYKTAL